MNTLFDFITHVKGIEYILAVMFITGYLIFWEILKPKPFGGLVKTVKDDAAYIEETGRKNLMKTIGKVAAAPFIGLAYVVTLPFAFLFAIGIAATEGIYKAVGREASFGWRPIEAYLSGRKKGKDEKKQKETK